MPLLPCPDRSFNQATGEHEYGGTPVFLCPYCRESGRATLLAKWRWYRDCRVTEEQIEEGVQQGREKIAPDWR
jgi:hypothetical protein